MPDRDAEAGRMLRVQGVHRERRAGGPVQRKERQCVAGERGVRVGAGRRFTSQAGGRREIPQV